MDPLEIRITRNEKGQVFVTFPEDKVLCFGLLKVAEITIANHTPSPIIKPNNIDKNLIN